tara:strand:- start:1687 stop:1866 length:180 start_codon:yes stop_codon:yes gene_type:complete
VLTVNVEFETMDEFIDYCFPRSKNYKKAKSQEVVTRADTPKEETKVVSQAVLFDSTLMD